MIGTVLLTGTVALVAAGQMSSTAPSRVGPVLPMDGHIDVHKPGDIDPLAPELLERQERSRNFDRQKRLVADTDRLLELATDLKSQVTKTDTRTDIKTDKGAPSVDAVRKAEEIEKLAKSVRDRMKG